MNIVLELAKFSLLACVGVFIAGTVITIALVPFALSNGLRAYANTREIKKMLAAGAETTWVHRTLLIVGKVQKISWVTGMVIIVVTLTCVVVTGFQAHKTTPNQSTDPTLSSGTPAAGQPARHP